MENWPHVNVGKQSSSDYTWVFIEAELKFNPLFPGTKARGGRECRGL